MALKVKGGFRFEYHVARQLPIVDVAQDQQSNTTDATASKSPFSDVKELTPNQIVAYIRSVGMVAEQGGMMADKLEAQLGKAQLLILNALECEPGVECVHAMLRNYPEQIVLGLKLFMRCLGIGKTVVAMTESMHTEAELLRKNLKQKSLLEIIALEEKYPVENDRVMYYALTGFASAPSYRDAVIVSVLDCYNMYCLFVTGALPKDRVVSVGGKQYRIPLGTPITDLPALCEVEVTQNCRAYIGGMVSAQPAKEDSVIKWDTRSVQFWEQGEGATENHCIHCGLCDAHCAIGIKPQLILSAMERGNIKQMARLYPEACIGCGVCSAVCPMRIPIAKKMIDYRKNTVEEEQVSTNEAK